MDDVKRVLKRMIDGPGFTEALSSAVVEKGDGYWPRLPAVVYENERLTHTSFPMAELLSYQSTFSDDDVVKKTRHRIGIRWTVACDTEAAATRDVERLVRATTDMLWCSNLDTRVQSGPILVEEEDYSPIIATPQHPFVKSATVILNVPVWRD